MKSIIETVCIEISRLPQTGPRYAVRRSLELWHLAKRYDAFRRGPYSNMAASARRNLNELLTVLSHQDSSDSSDDSLDEDDLDTLLLYSMFPKDINNFPRRNLEDLTDFQCEELFRQVKAFKFFIQTQIHNEN